MKRILVCCLVVCVAVVVAGATAGAAAALSYQPAVTYTTAYQPDTVIGDFNGDGFQDLASAALVDKALTVHLGDGDGGFGPEAVSACNRPWEVVSGDIDGDGLQDLVTAISSGGASFGVLLSNGDGTFATEVDHGPNVRCPAVAVADLNGDDKQDVIVALVDSAQVGVFLGNGDGTFTDIVTYDVGSGPYSLATADFDGDGNVDVATANNSGSSVSVLLGNGDGTLNAHVDYATPATPQWVESGDLDGDGDDDLAVATDSSVSVLLNNGDGTFAASVDYGMTGSACGLAIGDLNGDGMDDLAAAGPTDFVSIFLSTGAGAFGPAIPFAAPEAGWSMDIGDFNRDGKADLAKSNINYGVEILIGKWETPSGTMTIDDGAAATSERLVELHAAVAEARQMRLRNAGGAWGAWQPYAPNTYYTLPSGDGVKTVEAQYRNTVGQTGIISDDIVLDTTAPVTANDAPVVWTNQAVTVTLTPADAGAGMTGGLAKTEYSLDGGLTWTESTSATTAVLVAPDPVLHETDGLRLLYRSTDALGNAEPVHGCRVLLDTRGPAVSTTKASVRRGKTVQFKATVADTAPCAANGARVKVIIFGRRGGVVARIKVAGQAVNTRLSIPYRCRLARGTYRFKVYAADAADNAQTKVGVGKLVVR